MAEVKADAKSASSPLEDIVSRLKPDKMSGRMMKYPYTFTAKIAHFPYQLYTKNVWILRYFVFGIAASLPVFYKFQKLSCSPENKAKFEAKKAAERAAHH